MSKTTTQVHGCGVLNVVTLRLFAVIDCIRGIPRIVPREADVGQGELDIITIHTGRDTSPARTRKPIEPSHTTKDGTIGDRAGTFGSAALVKESGITGTAIVVELIASVSAR